VNIVSNVFPFNSRFLNSTLESRSKRVATPPANLVPRGGSRCAGSRSRCTGSRLMYLIIVAGKAGQESHEPACRSASARRQGHQGVRELHFFSCFSSCLGAFVVPLLDSAHKRDSESGTNHGFSSKLFRGMNACLPVTSSQSEDRWSALRFPRPAGIVNTDERTPETAG